MATVALLSIYDRNAYGLRLMSAQLKQAGHECHLIFLKRYDNSPTYELELEVGEYPWMGVSKNGRIYKYASNSQINDDELELLRQVIDEIKPDLIGTTVNTPLRVQSTKVTRYLKAHFDIPVVWGGYDPTVNPFDCLELCDYACLGEGDVTLLEIAQCVDEGRGFDNVKNLAFIRDGKRVVNDKHALVDVLDELPWRDNSPENKYFIEDRKLQRDYDVLTDKPDGVYQTMSSRGCPYQCAYCCEATMKDIYSGESFLRRRSPESVVAELAAYKKTHPLTQVHFEDEIFAMNLKWLEKFAPLYKEKVGVPFVAYIYPTRNIERILTLLGDAGLKFACLALESGSERINEKVFGRVYDRELFLFTAKVCRDLGIEFYTDVITYNPYEEEEDLKHTLDVLLEVGGGYSICINKLFVLPGTKMAMRMKSEGMEIGASEKDSMFNYYCRLYWITSFHSNARPMVKFIQSVPLFKRFPQLINPVVLEFIASPYCATRSAVMQRLPKKLAGRIQGWRLRQQALAHNGGTGDAKVAT